MRVVDLGILSHKTPRIPIMIDFQEADPLAVREFDGEPLYTVLDPDARDGKKLPIFTNSEKAHEYFCQLASASDSTWLFPSNRFRKTKLRQRRELMLLLKAGWSFTNMNTSGGVSGT